MEPNTILAIGLAVGFVVIAGVIVGVLFATGIFGKKSMKTDVIPFSPTQTIYPFFTPNIKPKPQPIFKLQDRITLPGRQDTITATQIRFNPLAQQGLVAFSQNKIMTLNSFSYIQGKLKITGFIDFLDRPTTIILDSPTWIEDQDTIVSVTESSKHVFKVVQYQDNSRPQNVVVPLNIQGYAGGAYSNDKKLVYVDASATQISTNIVEPTSIKQVQTITTPGKRGNSAYVTPRFLTYVDQISSGWILKVDEIAVITAGYQPLTQIKLQRSISGANQYKVATDQGAEKIIVMYFEPNGISSITTFTRNKETITQTDHMNLPDKYVAITPFFSTLPDLSMMSLQVKDTDNDGTFKTLVYRINNDMIIQGKDGTKSGILQGDPAEINIQADNLVLSSLAYEDNNSSSNILLFVSDLYQSLTVYKMIP